MKKIKLYLETSVWNFFYADDAPEKRDITEEFFNNIEKGYYDIFISRVVLEEIDGADEMTAHKLMNLINKFNPPRLDITEGVEELAGKYISASIIPQKKHEDALHASIASIYEMDALVSWNYRHLLNLNKKRRINEVNLQEGYRFIDIVTPMEVISYEG